MAPFNKTAKGTDRRQARSLRHDRAQTAKPTHWQLGWAAPGGDADGRHPSSNEGSASLKQLAQQRLAHGTSMNREGNGFRPGERAASVQREGWFAFQRLC